MMARVAQSIDELTAAHKGRDIVAVAHGGTIRAAVGHALGLSPARSLGFVVDNCSLTRLDHVDGGARGAAWRIVGLNLRPGL
jgi:broad specificity phosphatase PhoE